MPNLKYRQQKIQEKRKKTPRREFLMEIASWFPLNLYKSNNIISKYPITERVSNIVPAKERENYPLTTRTYSGNFMYDVTSLLKDSYLDNIDLYGSNENCDYAEAVYGAKNGYLSFSLGDNAEDILYSCFVRTNVSNILDSFYVEKDSDNVYKGNFIQSSFNIFYSKYITGCNNIWLSTNLIGCSECILCDDLQNKSYCINNTQYSKEEYVEKKKQILREKHTFEDIYSRLSGPKNKNTSHSKGSGLYQCENIENGYLVRNMRNSRNIICGTGGYTGSSYIYDGLDVGLDTHHMYGTGMAGTNSEHLYCCSGITKCSYLFYCYHLESCSYCLGCIGLKNKSFCIFNKQYSKDERHGKVDEIFSAMDKEGTLGNFFPGSMNPFYFNDTAAYLIDPSFTKEEVEAAGYMRRDEPIKVDIPEGVQTAKISELGQFESFDENGNWTISDEILKKVIIDEAGNAYRVIPMELDFLRKYGLPLPRKHWLKRLKGHFKVK